MPPLQRRPFGFTVSEILTALVIVAVLAAAAIPLWRAHLLRVRRADAVAALIAVQAAQDTFFGRQARYATGAELIAPSPAGLALDATSARGYYTIELHSSADGLGYTATARVLAREGQSADVRCAEFSIDQVGRRRAVDSAGADRSQDCWR